MAAGSKSQWTLAGLVPTLPRPGRAWHVGRAPHPERESLAMHFNLVDLRLMVRIADTCSLTRAAEASHISLSAASTRIKGLEESLGARFHVAPDGLGQLNGAYGAALLGLRRVEKLLAEGKPIPPTAAQQAPGEAGTTVRRWSALAPKKSVEPCRVTGTCPVVGKPVGKALETAA